VSLVYSSFGACFTNVREQNLPSPSREIRGRTSPRASSHPRFHRSYPPSLRTTVVPPHDPTISPLDSSYPLIGTAWERNNPFFLGHIHVSSRSLPPVCSERHGWKFVHPQCVCCCFPPLQWGNVSKTWAERCAGVTDGIVIRDSATSVSLGQ
jgi:hypothetical protein